ncbi:MAG: DUF4404 family protein [Pseudomonadota bacterium]|nr:DUF4404 family protein [Pseudomonadota bacterium]
MDQNNLRDQLAKLRAELTKAQQADPGSKQSLDDAMQDVHRMIAKPVDTAALQDATLPDRLEKIAVQFEADHPTLAASARRLVELLSEVGI